MVISHLNQTSVDLWKKKKNPMSAQRMAEILKNYNEKAIYHKLEDTLFYGWDGCGCDSIDLK